MMKRHNRYNINEKIINLIKDFLSSENLSITQFALSIAEKNGELQKIETIDEYCRLQSRCKQQLTRAINGKHAIPTDLITGIYDSLTDEYQHRFATEIYAVVGMLPLKISTDFTTTSGTPMMANLPAVTAAMGRLLLCAEPAHDNVYDERDDLLKLQKMQTALLSLASACLRESTAISMSTNVPAAGLEIENKNDNRIVTFCDSPSFARAF